MRTRNTQIKINLTEAEAKRFDIVRGKVRRSIAARLIILRQPIPKPINPAVANLSIQLHKIGVNLNQIARRLNAEPTSHALAVAAAAEITALRNSLTSVECEE